MPKTRDKSGSSSKKVVRKSTPRVAKGLAGLSKLGKLAPKKSGGRKKT